MSEQRDIAAEVKQIIADQLDIEVNDIKTTSTFIDDLGADSLGLVELVLALEESFGIEIPDQDTEKLRTVGDTIGYIESHFKA
jgi:acyl carrier protein